ncbi:helix-turn-helix domain-containing protein [Streptomyces sp. NPDC058475]|uniref:helix-turn-helix domain-containing protein n=1 Tax=Streptomyces sp. NPDC058475 TaxID=3346518 RepID=UPI00364F41CC
MTSPWNADRDAGDGGAVVGDEFAALLRELKERSGLSYGVLGKRLHLSTSTLHRYVNGDAVPTDYAPVERLARLCKATPEELLELHRRWVRADAMRGQKGAEIPAAGVDSGGGALRDAELDGVPDGVRGAEADGVRGAGRDGGPDAGPDAEPDGVPGAVTDAVTDAVTGVVSEVASEAVPGGQPGGRRRRRIVALAGAGVVAAVLSAVLVVNLVPGHKNDGQGAGEALAVSVPPAIGTRAGGAAPEVTQSSPAASPSASGSASGSRGGSPTASAAHGAAATARESGADGATAPAVATNAYKFEDPCSQHYLVNRKPAQVPPPPSEQDARGWVTALGGVAGNDQFLALTVQGTGKATVVLEALHVRVVQKGAPLAWNDYAMGVGCGGGVSTKTFDVNLDAGRPDVTPKHGQRDFPYKVSESDPEVFYVSAHAQAHDVSWYLELDWSSGDRQGTVRIDDDGKAFRTSGNVGRPAYDHPLGGSEWETAPAG